MWVSKLDWALERLRSFRERDTLGGYVGTMVWSLPTALQLFGHEAEALKNVFGLSTI